MNKKIGLAVVTVLGLAIATVMLISVTLGATVVANDFQIFEKTDRFTVMQTENGLSLISQDGELVIHVGDNTEIIFEKLFKQLSLTPLTINVDSQTLASLLDNRNLTVYYSVTTRSLPAQTTPEKIVILYEIAVPLPADIDCSAPIDVAGKSGLYDGLEALPADVDCSAPVGIVPPIYEFSPGELSDFL
jgi:hypothetical protein